jgi:hypothetical protein
MVQDAKGVEKCHFEMKEGEVKAQRLLLRCPITLSFFETELIL